MSLPEITLSQAVQRQYGVTMRSLGASFYRNLISLEISFCLLSFLATSTYGTNLNQLFHLRVREISGAQPLWAGILYITAMAWLMADNRLRSCAFTFVSNRLSHNLANIAVLFTMSAIAAVMGTLSMVLVRVVAALWGSQAFWSGFRYTPADLLISVLAAFGYSVLCAAIAYLFVIFLRRQPKLLAVLVPLTLFLGINVRPIGKAMGDIFFFYLGETSIALFVLKALCTALCLFAAACWGSKGLEVRRSW